jgi:hypothetical protein
MPVVNLNTNVLINSEEQSRATVANAVTMSCAIIKELIGKELSSSKGIDLETHITAVIGSEIDKKISKVKGV